LADIFNFAFTQAGKKPAKTI